MHIRFFFFQGSTMQTSVRCLMPTNPSWNSKSFLCKPSVTEVCTKAIGKTGVSGEYLLTP